MVDMISAGTLPCSAADAARNGQVKLSLSSQDGRLIVIVHACRCSPFTYKQKKVDMDNQRDNSTASSNYHLEIVF